MKHRVGDLIVLVGAEALAIYDVDTYKNNAATWVCTITRGDVCLVLDIEGDLTGYSCDMLLVTTYGLGWVIANEHLFGIA